MRTDQLLRMAVVSVLWLCMGAGCAKEPPKPEDNSCFGSGGARYAAKLEGVIIDTLIENFIILYEPVVDGTRPVDTCSSRLIYSGSLCPANEKTYQDLFKKLSSEPNYRSQKYKIWGSVYDSGSIPFNPLKMCDIQYLIRVDRIEKVK